MATSEEVLRALDEVEAKRAETLDTGRPKAVEKQHARGALTVRERLDRLFVPNSFVEWGQLVASHNPHVTAPSDGVVTGVGKVGGSTAAVLAYDYTVIAGSQGYNGHRKLERLAEVVDRLKCPVVMLLEGGGARAQDLLYFGVQADVVHTARLSGRVPLVGVALGRVFAGHANMAGICDIIIARRDACLGMAGPPLVYDALGLKLTPEDIGPADVHAASGVVDLLVNSDEEAIDAVKTYLNLVWEPDPPFDGEIAPDPGLRDAVPSNSRRAYDVRTVINRIADPGSLFELRAGFAKNIITALARVGGRTVGVIANQPLVKTGTVDSPAADKAARFLHLLDRFELPVLFLIDTPGFFMGPEAEREGLIRHSAGMLSAAANFRGPMLSVILRKAYGTAYWVMGSRNQYPTLHVAWPTAEVGSMNIPGASVLAGGEDEAEQARVQANLRRIGTPLWQAEQGFIDDVIDPAQTRPLIARTLALDQPPPDERTRTFPIDPW